VVQRERPLAVLHLDALVDEGGERFGALRVENVND